MMPMDTWGRNHGQTAHGPEDTIAWISPDGMAMSQIDYIATNLKYRNFVRKEYTAHPWRGNMEHHRQRSAVKIEIQLRYKRNYFTKPPKETGTEIHYNITQARKQPELLDQYLQDHQIKINYEQNKTTTENWDNARK